MVRAGNPYGSLLWYSDGSKTSSGTRMGIIGPSYIISKAMDKMTTVFQADHTLKNVLEGDKEVDNTFPMN